MKIQVLPLSEMAIPVTAVFNNVGANGKILEQVQNKTSVVWSDGSESIGVKHCGCALFINDGDLNILVDTGFGDINEIHHIRKQRGDKYYLTEINTIQEALKNIGISPEDIDIVVNTHLHWDHIGGNLAFPHARFYVPEDDLPYLYNPPCWASHFYPGTKKHIAELKNLVPVRGEGKISDHVSYLCLGGHTPGSLAVLIDSPKGIVAFAGDIVAKYENWDLDWIGPSGNIWNMSQLADAFSVLRERADIIIPGHDWKVFDRHPEGVVI